MLVPGNFVIILDIFTSFCDAKVVLINAPFACPFYQVMVVVVVVCKSNKHGLHKSFKGRGPKKMYFLYFLGFSSRSVTPPRYI